MDWMTDLLFGTRPIEWIQQLLGPGNPLPFRALSLLGDPWGVLLVLGLALWIFGRRTFHAVAGIVVAGAATKLVLTRLFSTARPSGPEITVYADLDMGSFPSGHVYEAVGPWGLLYAMGCVPFWIPAIIALLVGTGRLYLGAHYLGDLLGGIFFAVGLIWVFCRVWPHVRAWLARRSRTFHLAVALVVIAGTIVAISMTGAHPRRFEIYGILLGAASGMPLEHRWVRYERRRRGRTAAWKLLIGCAGLIAFLLWDRSQPREALLLGTCTAGLATLWVVLIAPGLFARWERGDRGGIPDEGPGMAGGRDSKLA